MKIAIAGAGYVGLTIVVECGKIFKTIGLEVTLFEYQA